MRDRLYKGRPRKYRTSVTKQTNFNDRASGRRGLGRKTVKTSTLESAKGHEFHAVFIVGLCAGNMPSDRIEESEWKREAARLYVGMTAPDQLYLTYNVGGRNSPSVFLSAIQHNCQECLFKNGKLTFEQ